MPYIIDKVNCMIAEKFRLDTTCLAGHVHFERDLGADGFDLSELLIDIEREFNIIISDDEADSIQTIGQVTGFVVKSVVPQA